MKATSHDEGVLDLAIIGYSQAGKTTLAAGLYASSSDDFTVIGEGEETEDYLRTCKARLEAGQWPEPSKERDRPELCLKVLRKGLSPVHMRFTDYMGALACNAESFRRTVIGKPRAALLLLNPKMEILSDAVRRVEMLSQMREIVDYLASDAVGCEYVAVVTTACDLLEKCDAAFRTDFEGYKDEIVRMLKVSRFGERNAWKEFRVTVSGPLANPEHPCLVKGDGNTARQPFQWIVEQLERGARAVASKRRRRHVLMAGCALLAVLALASVAWYYVFDRLPERELARQEEIAQTLLGRDPDAEAVGKWYATLTDAIVRAECARAVFPENAARLAAATADLRERMTERMSDELMPLVIKKRIASKTTSRYFPQLEDADRVFFKELSDKYGLSSGSFDARIDFEMAVVRNDWCASQDVECANMVDKINATSSVLEALGDFDVFCHDHPGAPGLTNVVRVMHGKVGDAICGLVQELEAGPCTNNYHKNFNDMRAICNRLLRVKGPLTNSCWHAFARDCQAELSLSNAVMNAFTQTNTVDDILVTFDVKELHETPQPMEFHCYFAYAGGDDILPGVVVSTNLTGTGATSMVLPVEGLCHVGNLWNPVWLIVHGKIATPECWHILKCPRVCGRLADASDGLQRYDYDEWGTHNTDVDVTVHADMTLMGRRITDLLPKQKERELEF